MIKHRPYSTIQFITYYLPSEYTRNTTHKMYISKKERVCRVSRVCVALSAKSYRRALEAQSRTDLPRRAHLRSTCSHVDLRNMCHVKIKAHVKYGLGFMKSTTVHAHTMHKTNIGTGGVPRTLGLGRALAAHLQSAGGAWGGGAVRRYVAPAS